jgi:ribosomal protein S3
MDIEIEIANLERMIEKMRVKMKATKPGKLRGNAEKVLHQMESDLKNLKQKQ